MSVRPVPQIGAVRGALGLGQDQLEQVLSRGNEPPTPVERDGAAIRILDHGLQRTSALRDREALGELEQLPPHSFGLVRGADEKLLDADAVARPLDGDIAGCRAFDLGDEDRVGLEHGERSRIVPGRLFAESTLGEPEEEALVLRPVRSDLGLSVRHAQLDSSAFRAPVEPTRRTAGS
jgi:hypothetical protein